jgi:hypothetical protein
VIYKHYTQGENVVMFPIANYKCDLAKKRKNYFEYSSENKRSVILAKKKYKNYVEYSRLLKIREG